MLTDEQQHAVSLVAGARPPLAILTGGPGTGKTHTIKAILEECGARGLRTQCAAPSGKAAQRMQEATGVRASTLHRLMGLLPESIDWYPISADVLVVDESSMADVSLMSCTLQAAKAGGVGTVLLVGDADQLPPVGPGQPFLDLVAAGACPVVRLTKIHRQAQDSGIVKAAHAIIRGEEPDLGLPDFQLVEVDELEDVPAACWDLIVSNGLDPDESQVLAPQRNTAGGVEAICRHVELARRPLERGEVLVRDRFRRGTKVINKRNDYQLEVFNGDLGEVVEAADGGGIRAHDRLEVQIAGGVKTYRGGAIGSLRPAWALTTHSCVHPDTLVSTPQGILPISSIASKGLIATAGGPKGYRNKVSNPPGPGLIIRTKRGFSVRVTLDHKMMAWHAGQPEYSEVRAENLTTGHWLRLARGPMFERRKAELPGLPSGLDVRCVIPKRLPRFLDETTAELIGLIVADGTVFHRGVRLVKRHPEVGKRFIELVGQVFGVKAKPCKSPGATGGEVHNTAIAEWLRSVGGMAPRKKGIPLCVMKSPPSVQRAFFRGLFEDGSAHIKPGMTFSHIEWSNRSQEMVETAQRMLLDLGILSSVRTLRYAKRSMTRLWIYGRDAGLFRDQIGFISKEKQRRLGGAGWSHEPIEPLVADRIASIEEIKMPSACVEVPGFHRFIQNGFDGSNSQGSQWEDVIVVAHTAHTYMLTRRLLYVAVTRAAKRVWIVGQREAVERAVRNTRDSKRRTWLAARFKRDKETSA